MTRSDLSELIERVEGASGHDRGLDAEIGAHFQQIDAKLHALVEGYTYRWKGEGDRIYATIYNMEGQPMSGGASRIAPDYTSCTTAALALVERVLPGWRRLIGEFPAPGGTTIWTADLFGANTVKTGRAPTAPLAILSALLRALSNEATDD